jgi:hypothetical protein
MSRTARSRFPRPFRLYACGQLAVMAGAWAMHATGSMVPMALGASASLMLTVPLIRHVRARAAARRL